jgi:hypothetical protein
MFRWMVLFLALALLSACESTDVRMKSAKDILADPAEHMRAPEFSPATLPLGVREKIVAGGAGTSKPLALAFEREISATGQTGKVQGRLALVPLGDGLFHVVTEILSNGIPVRTTFGLCYLGIDCMAQQSVSHTQLDVRSVTQVIDIKELTPGRAAPANAAQFVIEMTARTRFASGYPIENNERSVCRAGNRYAAARLHPRLLGEAVELSCEVFVDKVLQMRLRQAVLFDYGAAVMIEASEARAVTRVTFTDVLDTAERRLAP